MTTNLNWDLESIFAGGSHSTELADFLSNLNHDLTQAEADALPEELTDETEAICIKIILESYELGARLSQARAFANYLTSQNVKDDKAMQVSAKIDQMVARLETLTMQLFAAAAKQDDAVWNRLINLEALKPIAFHLSEQRDIVRKKMAPEMETLVTELATDGYRAWNRLYGLMSGDKEVEFDGKPISLGQLESKYQNDPDRAVRLKAFNLFKDAWGDLARNCALALNHQAGFRLTMYKHRGWNSVLDEPLQTNRLSAETLEAMWDVIDTKSDKLLDYFAAKASLYGLERLGWIDVLAPVGEVQRSFTYQEAADFVVDNINSLNPDIANYCRMAVDKRWVEAEDRPGKRAGAYCTSLPLTKESRIFMTYNGSYRDMLTLAHELGHGYHHWVMRNLPYGARRFAMSVAETASTFNEIIVRDASLNAAASDQERLTILGTKLNHAAAMLMNIRARFDFERAFFAERTNKSLGVDELNELMVTAQKTAYKNGLADYHPLFWASKLHFYLTQIPFYNFPYTFGYLFSIGIYAQAITEGQAFQERYIALLRDTGSMTTETLAKTHLGLDITRPEFWERALDRVLADVDPFVALAKQAVSADK